MKRSVAVRAVAGLSALLATGCTSQPQCSPEPNQDACASATSVGPVTGSAAAGSDTAGAGGGASPGAADSSVDPPIRRSTDAAAPPVDAGHDAAPPVDAGHDASLPARDAATSAEPVACSDEPPPSGSRCGVEGEVCARWSTDLATGDDHYFACHCRPRTSTSLVWACYERTQARCPHETQNDGDSCFGYLDQRCPYPPRRHCTCPTVGADPRWDCQDPLPPPDAPATIDAGKLVRDLTAEERQAWCAWFLEASVQPGEPLPRDLPADETGYYPGTPCTGCAGGVGVGGMMPLALPVSACVANLELSTCGATVAQFNDCIRSMFSACWPQGHGCPAFFETPGCDGTIASQGAYCGVRIE